MTLIEIVATIICGIIVIYMIFALFGMLLNDKGYWAIDDSLTYYKNKLFLKGWRLRYSEQYSMPCAVLIILSHGNKAYGMRGALAKKTIDYILANKDVSYLKDFEVDPNIK